MKSVSPLPWRERAWAKLHSPWSVRILLAAVAVVVSHSFQWEWLRSLTAEANLRLDTIAGLHLERLSSDTVLWRGIVFHYVTACTFIDVWFGAIPLLWSVRQSIHRNLQLLVAFGVGLFCFNILRLSVSDVLFSMGLPWWVGHDLLGAFAYFAVWCWIMRYRDWGSSVEIPEEHTISA